MCIRHELSAETHTSAPVPVTEASLSSSIAAEVSAFFTANVPPKPQHSADPGRSTSSSPRTRERRRSGRSPTCSRRAEWQVGW